MIRQWVRDSILAFMDLVPNRAAIKVFFSLFIHLPNLPWRSRTSTELPIDNENSTYNEMIVVYMFRIITVWMPGCYSEVISIKFIFFLILLSSDSQQLISPSKPCSWKFFLLIFVLNRKSEAVNTVIMESEPIEPSLIAMDSCFTAFDKDWWVLFLVIYF